MEQAQFDIKGNKVHEDNYYSTCKQGNETVQMDVDRNIQETDLDSMHNIFGDGNILKKYRLREPKKCSNKYKRYESSDSNDEGLVCRVCEYTAKSKTGLRNHMKIHEPAHRFTCSLCRRVFNTNAELLDHKMAHNDEDHTRLCKRCQLAFSNHLDYLQHMAEHSKGPRYHCKECSKTLFTKEGLKVHIQTHFYRPIDCPQCGKCCIGKKCYSLHLRTHTELYKCEECGKDCESAGRLKHHMVCHTGVKLIQCIYCGKGFMTTQQRNTHTRIHTGEKPFQCNTCFQTFRQETDLNRHMMSHATEKNFQCEYCKKKFYYKQSMVTHTKIHTKINLYPCLECEKHCTTRNALRTHVIHMHTCEKLYRCDLCNVDFKMKHHFNRHNHSIKHSNQMHHAHKKLKKLNDTVSRES